MKVFFMDESFNTGNDWKEASQPYFTYGGWLVDEEKLQDVRSRVLEFANNYQGELKSKSFVSFKGMKKVINLSNNLIEKEGAIPFFICYEKKYMLACAIVEIFFDHKTNKRVNGYLTFPNEYEYLRITVQKRNFTTLEIHSVLASDYKTPPIKATKKGLAEIISRDVDFCDYVGDVINGNIKDIQCVNIIIEKLRNIFLTSNLKNIADLFVAKNFDKKTIYEELMGTELENQKKRVKKSLLVQPSIFEIVQNLKNKYPNLKVVVDTLGDQNNQFSEMESLLKVDIQIQHDSQAEPMIMASDLLIGYIARNIKGILEDRTEVETSLLASLLKKDKSFFEGSDSWWYLKFSEESGENLMSKLEIPFEKTDYLQVLTTNFHEFIKISSIKNTFHKKKTKKRKN
ncbi:DUF3800 domain-containing protein [Paenibacillus taichungensis]|uniref:DUF3800 domain-containing protein n=1 Tax=Paenibacillus taichungensis TaxID=484184 RepID=UPI0028725FAA|nr:DUF3800 domain-containing protein [Paenibacillus taichungensis]MDR9744405.1 DUF3800 domain-containing protein [Paenibacillus taichungensis]